MSVNIIGQKVAKDNQINVTKLTAPRNIYEASGAPLDIIGESEFYVKLPVLGKGKQLTCLVLRGEDFDCLNNIDDFFIILKHIERIRRTNWEANETL